MIDLPEEEPQQDRVTRLVLLVFLQHQLPLSLIELRR